MTIEKIDNISPKDFYENFVKKGVPAILKNASQSWKDNSIFTPEFFATNFGSRVTTFNGREYTMTEILEITKNSTRENPAPYPIQYEIPIQLPELMDAIHPIHLNYSRPNWFRSKLLPYGKIGNSIHLFIGGQGNSYGIHKDIYHTNAWITQLYGQKDFILFPRDQEHLLYPESTSTDMKNCGSPIDILNPDFERYPLFKHATPTWVTAEQGETMFIPNGMWHTTAAHAQNISLIYDQLNSSNFKAWSKDMYNYAVPNSKKKAVINYSFAMIMGNGMRFLELLGAKF